MDWIKHSVSNINSELQKVDLNRTKFNENFKGKRIHNIIGLKEGSEKCEILFTDGSAIEMFHEQDCCESVLIDQVDNDVERHIGAIFYGINTKTLNNEDTPQWNKEDSYNESITATFYDIVTSKGRLSFRWCGESNGYYSEDVTVRYRE